MDFNRHIYRVANGRAACLIGMYLEKEPMPYRDEANNFFYISELRNLRTGLWKLDTQASYMEYLQGLRNKYDKWAYTSKNDIARISLQAVEDTIYIIRHPSKIHAKITEYIMERR